jgi:uncharacterized protein involved in response to NO
MLNIQTHSPYRYFFVISFIGLLIGLAQFLFTYNGYGIAWHREIMITLFLLPAAAGFLYTASPRFLNTNPAEKKDIVILFLLFTTLFVAYTYNSLRVFHLLRLATITVIAFFFVLRWLKRGVENPFWPPFILVSLGTGWMASSIQCLGHFLILPVFLSNLASHLYYEAMFWILLFGIGLKFFPMLTGAISPVYKNNRFSMLSREAFEDKKTWFTFALLALASFIITELVKPEWGLSLRAILLFFMAYHGWALFEKPQRKGYTTKILTTYLVTILVGQTLFIFWPEQLVHLYHIMFVCGFLSLTIAVETRVLLSHEHLDLTYEQNSKLLLMGYILIYIGMLCRVFSVATPTQFIAYMHYASGFALTGVLILFIQLARMIWRKSRNDQ